MIRPVDVQSGDPRLSLDPESVSKCLNCMDGSEEFSVAEGSLAVAFIDPQECSRLHEAFFNDPEITDVMTFPGDPDDEHAGDIAICPQVASSASLESGLPFAQELTLYLAHAWLHLAGLDDRDDTARKEMRLAEKLIMDRLAKHDSFLSCAWSD